MNKLQEWFGEFVENNIKNNGRVGHYVNFDVFDFWNKMRFYKSKIIGFNNLFSSEVYKFQINVYSNTGVLDKFWEIYKFIVKYYVKTGKLPILSFNDYLSFIKDSLNILNYITLNNIIVKYPNSTNKVDLLKLLDLKQHESILLNGRYDKLKINSEDFPDYFEGFSDDLKYKPFNPYLYVGGVEYYKRFLLAMKTEWIKELKNCSSPLRYEILIVLLEQTDELLDKINR